MAARHSKADSARTVNMDVDITVEAMGNAYQNIDRSANKIVVVDNQKVPAPIAVVDTANLTDDSLAALANQVVGEKPVAKPAPAQKSAPTKPAVHIVKSGDTLSAIDRKYHTTVDKLCKLNHIKEDGILSLGQKIKLR